MEEGKIGGITIDEDELVDIVIRLMTRSPDEWYIDYSSPVGLHVLKSTWGSSIGLNRETREAHSILPYYAKFSPANATRLFEYVGKWEENKLDILSNVNIYNEPYSKPCKAEDSCFESRLITLIMGSFVVYVIAVILAMGLYH